MKLTLTILCVSACCALAQLPPMPAAPVLKAQPHYTAVKTASKPAAKLAAAPLVSGAVLPLGPGTVLTWGPPTNSFYAFMATTNLLSWYCRTNVPLTTTNVFIPQRADGTPEFYRACTVLKDADGTYTVQDITCYTNGPTP